jgi:hypothetical protein
VQNLFLVGGFMKKVLLGLVLTGVALAAPTKPLLSKASGGGFMAPEYSGYERCDVYPDKVVITHQFGYVTETALQVNEERKINLVGNVKLVVEKAAQEKVEEKPNGLCDGPSTTIQADNGGQALLLFTTGGCGSPRKDRSGPLSTKLKEIVNLYCPRTIDFAHGE